MVFVLVAIFVFKRISKVIVVVMKNLSLAYPKTLMGLVFPIVNAQMDSNAIFWIVIVVLILVLISVLAFVDLVLQVVFLQTVRESAFRIILSCIRSKLLWTNRYSYYHFIKLFSLSESIFSYNFNFTIYYYYTPSM